MQLAYKKQVHGYCILLIDAPIGEAWTSAARVSNASVAYSHVHFRVALTPYITM